MNFTGFYGNEPIKTILNAHLFHAYLIEGPAGSGKHTLAKLITNALVCDGEEKPCGVCRQCYKVQQNCHPDILDIPSDIPVDELRQILAGIVLSPNDAAHKVYRIDQAEKLHPAAQNLLLKTLEEPPAYAVFLLLCNAKEGVLETIRSRCQTLTLAPLPEETIREHFIQTVGRYDESARNATLLSAGFLGKALEIYQAGDGERVEQCKALTSALQKNDTLAVFRIFTFADRKNLVELYQAFS
ncbi:MAG: DNA polymerase III subunit delta, partial [Clostridia bacterium]|nr:DNA polymerase III subunit delta [Clostridia bacterium]